MDTPDPAHSTELLPSIDVLLATDPFTLTPTQQRKALVAAQAAAARISAFQMELLAAVCGTSPRMREVTVTDADSLSDPDDVAARRGGELVAVSFDDAPDACLRTITLVDEVVDEIAALLHRTPGSVSYELKRARLLHGPLAPARQRLEAGEISTRHAQVIADQAARMLPDSFADAVDTDSPAGTEFAAKCMALSERVLPVAATSTWQRTEHACRRAVVQIDAAAERMRRERAKAGCDVYARAEDDGLASIIAVMPALDAARAMGLVESHARMTMTSATPLIADPHATIGQHRAAALLDLLTGGVACPDIETRASASQSSGRAGRVGTGAVEIQVLVDARVLAGLAPDGAGFVSAGKAGSIAIGRDDIVALISNESIPTVFRRLLLDPVSGALIDRGAKTYAPNADLIAWLQTRDARCRFPGCTADAARCDVDHAVDFEDGGPTTIANTGLLCRRHHNRKTHAGWTIEDTRDDGSCLFVSPTGERHRHHPASLAELMVEYPPPVESPFESPPLSAIPIHTAGDITAPPCGHASAHCSTLECSAPHGRDPDTGEPFPF